MSLDADRHERLVEIEAELEAANARIAELGGLLSRCQSEKLVHIGNAERLSEEVTALRYRLNRRMEKASGGLEDCEDAIEALRESAKNALSVLSEHQQRLAERAEVDR
jgi:chromosome segregation ATPase